VPPVMEWYTINTLFMGQNPVGYVLRLPKSLTDCNSEAISRYFRHPQTSASSIEVRKCFTMP
jgi:hypothetical protein